MSFFDIDVQPFPLKSECDNGLTLTVRVFASSEKRALTIVERYCSGVIAKVKRVVTA